MMPESYGLPHGAAVNYGQSGFPAWVYRLADRWGLKASTYPGHQESQRSDIGAAPNPQGLNRGIDWTGPPQNMLDFAKWLRDSAPPGLEMVIYQDPRTGEHVGYPSWVNYDSDYGAHTDHVHTRNSRAIVTEAKLKNEELAAPSPDRELLERVWDQLLGPGGNGWPQLGGKSLVDAVAELIKNDQKPLCPRPPTARTGPAKKAAPGHRTVGQD